MKKITLLLMVALAAITMSAATITIPEEAKAWNIPAEAIDVLQAREICAGLEADVPTTKMYYVMGYVKLVSSKNTETVSEYGQARFYLENVKGANSEEEFDAYQVYGLNGVKINNPDVVAAGDFVVIYGPLTKHQYEGGDVAYQTPGKGAAYIWNSTNPKLHNDTETTPDTPTDESLVIPEEAKLWNIPAEAIDVLEAREICAGLASGTTSGTKYYVMGYVKNIHNKHADGVANYGNAQFYMENVKGANSSEDFMAYQVYGLNGEKITDPNVVAVGDFVVVYGELTNYNGTYYETVGKGAAYIWNSTNPKLHNDTETTPDTPNDTVTTPDTPTDESLVIPEEAKAWNIPAEAIDVLQAREICAGLASGTTSGTKYYVMGYVKKLHNNHESGVAYYGNAQFFMENVKGGNSQNDFMAYQVYGLNGEKITDPNAVAEGDFVVVYGELTNYNGTYYETVGKGAAYIWNSTNPLIAGDPNLVTIKDLVYADAYYAEEDGVGYYNLDMYKSYEDDYVYPRLDVTVKAISKTALNGTYELLEATYYASASESVAMGETAGTLTIKNVDTEGNYSISGSFVGTDGKTYKFDQNLKLGAYDLDDDEEPIELEDGQSTPGTDPVIPGDAIVFDANVDMGNATTDYNQAAAYQITKNGVTLDVTKGIIGVFNNENNYRVYRNQTLTLTSTAGNIVKVEFTCTANNDAQYGPGCFTVTDGEYNYSGPVGTWTGGASTVTFTAELNQVRIKQIAVFVEEMGPVQTHVLTVLSNDNAMGSVSGSGTYEQGQSVTISATANKGYHFSHWSDGNTDNPRVVQVTEDQTYTAYFDKNTYYITKNYDSNQGYINGSSSGEYLDNITLTAKANYGYHFVQWSDGNTENPRSLILTQDTILTAEFAANKYLISTVLNDPKRGTTSGDTLAAYLDYVTISATAKYGYHFSSWENDNADNPRLVQVTGDKEYMAYFDKNTYTVTTSCDGSYGTVSPSVTGEYLDTVTLTATPTLGYHFSRWSDGNTDNPRSFVLTQDTTFSAKFTQSFSGQCGDDLYWAYNESVQSIAITGTGDMYNYTSGTQPWVLFLEKIKKVTTDNTAASLGTSAFEGAIRLTEVHIGTSIETIDKYAFGQCDRLRNIYCYPTYPPIIRESSFARYDALLYIPCDYLDDYVFDRNWKKFENIQCAGAEKEEIESDDVDVDPSSTSVTMTWPTEENAYTYTIEIHKDGALFCRLVFNTEGQLLNLSFAPGRDGNNRPALYAEQVANGSGLRFTVTGLNARTHYTYDLRAKDKDENTIQSHSGEFTTQSDVTTSVSDSQSPMANCQKIFRNGQLIILRDGVEYNAMGQEIQ